MRTITAQRTPTVKRLRQVRADHFPEAITFNGSTPAVQCLSQWSVNKSTGQWAIGAANNDVLNPSFEADRVQTTALTGWQKWTPEPRPTAT